MYLFPNRFTLSARAEVEPYLTGYEYRCSGLTFTSLFMWCEENHFSWQVIGDYLCIAGISHLEIEKQEAFLFPPLTRTGQYDPERLGETLAEAKRIFEAAGRPFCLRLLPQAMVPLIEAACPDAFEFIEDPPNHEYVYLAEDLIYLRGRRYSAKRNHLKRFKENAALEYIRLTSAMAPQAMDFIRAFNRARQIPEHERQLLQMEEAAMAKVFGNLEAGGYRSGALLIDGKIEALTLGGPVGKDMLTVHVEKANIAYPGIYPAIMNEFAKREATQTTYINREEDMDIPGLRKAKLSYYPVELILMSVARLKKRG